MLATSKNVLFSGHNHLLTTGTDDLILLRSGRQWATHPEFDLTEFQTYDPLT